jgi:hypothetical protein
LSCKIEQKSKKFNNTIIFESWNSENLMKNKRRFRFETKKEYSAKRKEEELTNDEYVRNKAELCEENKKSLKPKIWHLANHEIIVPVREKSDSSVYTREKYSLKLSEHILSKVLTKDVLTEFAVDQSSIDSHFQGNNRGRNQRFVRVLACTLNSSVFIIADAKKYWAEVLFIFQSIQCFLMECICLICFFPQITKFLHQSSSSSQPKIKENSITYIFEQ